MKIKNYLKLGLVLGIGFLGACDDMDATYDELIKDGEINYTSKVDSVKVLPGRNRVKLDLIIPVTSKASELKIFWNNRKDSVRVPVALPSGSRKMSVILPDLDEGSHTFNIIAYDNVGNKSVGVTAPGTVYGENYQSTLKVRDVKAVNVVKGLGTIEWYGTTPEAVATEVKYTDNAGVEKVLLVPAGEFMTEMPKYKAGRSFTYRTLYKPEPNAIDTFYTASASKEIIAAPALADKSLFATVKLPGDRWQAHLNNGSWNLERAWDGITDNENLLFHATRTGFPATVTIDLGAEYELTYMKIWGRIAAGAAFNKGNLKEFEIYGRADAPDLADGSMNGWTKILEGSSVKPSGLPDYQANAEDLAYLREGEKYDFLPNISPVRYIRIKVLDSWGPPADNYWYFTELSFWGFEQ